MSRVKPEKFSDRLQELLAEGMLRHGVLGKISSYGSEFDPRVEYYRVFRPNLKTKKGSWGHEYFKDVPSLADLRCPTCKSELKVAKVEETVDYVFAGTFVDSDPWTHATGKLLCTKNDNHVRDAFKQALSYVWSEDQVQYNGTIADLTKQLDEIAEEWGW